MNIMWACVCFDKKSIFAVYNLCMDGQCVRMGEVMQEFELNEFHYTDR